VEIPDLRPLSFGELLDRTFTYYRRHFWTFVGIMAVPQVLIVAVNVFWRVFQSRLMESARNSPPNANFSEGYVITVALGTILILVVYFVMYAVALGAATNAVSEIHLGRPTTARAAYRSMRGRYWRLADLIFTIMLRVILFFFLVMFAIGASAGLIGILVGSLGPLAGVLMGLLAFALFVAGGVFAVWFFLRYGCSVPAMLLENLKAGAALKRSIALTKGNTGRVFLVTLLMTLVNWTVGIILEGPFFVLLIFMSAKTHQPPPLWATAGINIAGGVGHALTGSLLMIGLVLLYYDIRVRKEGFDLQLMMTTLDTQAPIAGAAQPIPATAPLALERTNVLLVILLTIITLGFYYPYWFIRNRTGINSLNSPEKLGYGIFAFVFALWLFEWVFLVVAGQLDEIPSLSRFGLGDTVASLLAVFFVLATAGSGILLLVQAFKVKRMLEAHTAVSTAGPLAGSLALVQGSTYSVLATFFLGIYYLQYKINEVVDAAAQSRPGVGSGFIPAV
jgi:Domain of unknown function (DUF4234)